MERKVFYKNEIRILALVVFIMSMVFTFKSYAAEVTDTWESGNTIVTYDSDGVLTVTAKPGTDGRMAKYTYSALPEWSTKSVSAINIEGSVKYIGDYAFCKLGNKGTTFVLSLPEGLEEIGRCIIFKNTAVHEVVLPTTLKKAETLALSSETLRIARIKSSVPSGLTYIFNNGTEADIPNLSDIYFESNVTEVSENIATGTIAHKVTVHILGDNVKLNKYALVGLKNAEIIGLENISYYEYGSLPQNIVFNYTDIGSNIKSFCISKLGDYKTLTANQINSLLKQFEEAPELILMDLAVDGVIWPENLKVIPTNAFSGSVKPIIIENGVERVEKGGFNNVKFTTVDFPSSINYIGSQIFYGSQVIECNLPNNSVDAQMSAFEVGSSKTIKYFLPENFSFSGSLGFGAYFGYSPVEIEIADGSVYTRNNGVIYDRNNLVRYIEPDGVISANAISIAADVNYYFESDLTLPANLQSVEKGMFGYPKGDKKTITILNGDLELKDFTVEDKNYFMSNSKTAVNIFAPNNSSVFNQLKAAGYTVYASDVERHWKSGDISIDLSLDGKTLILSGIGDMIDYDSEENVPWKNSGYDRVIIPKGVMSIGAYSFMGDTVIMKYQTNGVGSIAPKYIIGNHAFENSVITAQTDLFQTGNICGWYLGEVGDGAFKNATVTFTCNSTLPGFMLSGDVGKEAFVGSKVTKGGYYVINPEVSVVDGAFDVYPTVLYFGMNNIIPYIAVSDSLIENINSVTINNAWFTNETIDLVDWSNATLATTVNWPFRNCTIDTLKIKEWMASGISNPTINFNGDITNYWYGSGNPLVGVGVQNFYWDYKGTVSSNVVIDAGTKIFVYNGSPAETWCKNKSRDYDYITDEMINGKLPTLEKDSFMFDGESIKDLSFTVNLGEKPAGATDIKKVLVDNEMIPIDSWEFNGTNKVTIFGEYLETLTNGTHTVSVLFNNDTFRSGATITVINSQQGNGSDEPPEALVTITYEFYKDYPDYVIIPVKLNGASAITRLRLGSMEVDEADYKLEDGAIILDKDLLLTVDVGKYRVLPTFNDKDKTTLTNIQLVVYENAADRAAPYLLQSRLIFDNSPIVLKFAPGAGDLTATNVLALILDDDVILPTGELVPFTKKNVLKVQAAYKEALEIDQPYVREDVEEEEIVATPSDATKKDDADYVEDDMQVEVGTPSEATKPDEDEIIDEDFLVNEDIDDGFLIDEEEDNEDNVASPSEASFVVTSLPTRSQRANRFSLLTVSESKKDKDEDKEDEPSELAMVMAELEYGTNNVFYVDGDEIILDADYIESLNLSEGDHLIGAIFDNTERTTDVKKVILTIPSSGDSGDDNKPVDPDDNKPVNPDDNKPENPDDNKPSNPDGDKPVNPPVDEDDNNSSGGGNGGSSGGGGGSHSGGGSTGGNSKPDNGNGPGNDSILKPDGSINPDYTTDVPDNGGRWEGSGNDWTYILPDGSVPKGEWVGDGENWFYVNKDGKLEYDWFCDPVTNKWYMLNRENNGKFGAALKGWYFEVQDGKYYFLNPGDFSMFTGWAFINSEWYFFSPTPEGITYIGDNQSGWKFDTNTTLRPYGSMFINETTPDGYKVDNTGKYVK